MNETPIDHTSASAQTLSRGQCILVLVVAFLGWMFAGVQMGINSIAHHPAASQLLGAAADPADIGKWSGWLVCAFLLGAAAGGYAFGWVGDRFGRAKAMAISIACYSVFSYLSTFSQSIEVFWALRFITCMGIGGMWPNGMALIQEAWPNTAKPILAGILGTSANVGIMLFALLCMNIDVNPDSWRWTLMVGASPIVLALVCWFLVPESPKWLAEQQQASQSDNHDQVGLGEVFSPPHLKLTLIGIVLAFVPLFGGWGVANWANYWAAEYDEKVVTAGKQSSPVEKAVSESPSEVGKTKSNLKAETSFNRAWPGSISSLLGGALAFLLGRRFSYALLCVLAFTCTQFLYALPDPSDESFMFWIRGLGFFSGFFFGWLPLCLPEMFPTRIRSTGSGVSFNFGRIIVALLLIVTSLALKEYFEGNYDQVGQICGFMYLVGIAAVFMMPTSGETVRTSPTG
ncbi:MAG: MFS transporter [Pirellulaceae bacterium]|jgi:SHS family sialic acid transporter-like MFS transporter|nr:MFS transporter [Pirellulaceae bacterium]